MSSTDTSIAAEQRLQGRQRRREVSREAVAAWSFPPDRPDPVETVVQEDADRVPELVPIRHARMAASPFAFFRGSASIMAADLADCPSSGIEVQSCGDAHLANFGVFATPERRLVFDLNDFDETLQAPFEWDVKRLAASFVVAAKALGVGKSGQESLAGAAVRQYRLAILRDAERPLLDVWFQSVPVDTLVEQLLSRAGKQARQRAKQGLRKTRGRTNLGALGRFAELTDDGWRIKPQPPLIQTYERTARDEKRVAAMFSKYANTLSPERQQLFSSYRLADFARKVVGVGSVGTEAFMFLFIGPQGDDPLFLQLKQAGTSCLAKYVDQPPARHEGQRIVDGQRAMQAASDAFLGWTSGGTKNAQHFYVRQLRDMKGSANLDRMSRAELDVYAKLCGETLARAHARSGRAPAIAGYVGRGEVFERKLARSAVKYARQTESDHAAFVQASESGRLAVQSA
ncbi:MAG: DUF2252 domain-containing protein [Thermoleophilaceae bacterium]|nr:DUF2252 domain-containing protein [Thermoleophilaceae bacterium]